MRVVSIPRHDRDCKPYTKADHDIVRKDYITHVHCEYGLRIWTIIILPHVAHCRYTTVVSQCGSHQQLRKALELVAEMRGRGIALNCHAFSALMNGAPPIHQGAHFLGSDLLSQTSAGSIGLSARPAVVLSSDMHTGLARATPLGVRGS